MFDVKHFPGAKKFWHMGKIYDWDTVNVHVMSHALHYGSSVFEGIRAYDTSAGPAIFRLEEHIDRFFISGEVMNMTVPYSKTEIIETIKAVMRENKLRAAYIRPNMFFGYGNLGLVPKASPVELSIACWGWGAYLGEEGLEKGVHTMLLPNKRIHTSQMDMRAKVGGMYAQSNIAGSFARKQGFDEGIFLNLEGRIAEGPGENIIIVKNKVVKTNDMSESILEGITRTTVLQLARDLGYEVVVEPIEVEELLSAEEVFFTGTAAEVTPITRITDGRDVGKPRAEWALHTIGSGVPGPVTKQLASRYSDVVRGKMPEYSSWMTFVYDSPGSADANTHQNEYEKSTSL